MPKLDFVGQSRANDTNDVATARLINCYREGNKDGKMIVKSVLGQELFVNLDAVFMRAIKEVSGVMYAVCGERLFSITSGGLASSLGAVLDGNTSISGNNGAITIAADGDYYVYSDGALEQPDTGAFDSVGSVDFLGQFTLITEKDGRRVSWSSPADPETFDALDVKTKEGADEHILRGKVINGYWWLFSENSSETWYQTGLAGVDAFSRLSGATSDVGLKGYDLIVEVPDGAFFIGSDNRARLTRGGESTPVSTTDVEQSIANSEIRSCGYYEDNGHSICVVTFTDRPAWCLDISTGEWHERSRSVYHNPWDVVGTVQVYGDWYAAHYDGKIRKYERSNADDGDVLRRTMISETLDFSGQRMRIKSLEVIARRGAHSIREPSLMLSTSGDTAKTWNEHTTRGLGEQGDYDKRAVWRSLGLFRQFTMRLDITDPVEVPVNATGVIEVA